MQPDFDDLVEIVLQHVQHLKEGGVKHLPIRPETLAGLNASPVRELRREKSPTPQASRPAAGPVLNQESRPARVVFSNRPSETGPVPKVAAAPEQNTISKEAAMAELRERACACRKCPHLALSRKNVVFGVGDIHSPLMFVGEAPGADEDAQGEPFVGAAGQLLTRIIRAMGLSRDTVYIANILKCRPDTPGQTFGNRKPTPEEMKTCLPYLLSQIELIQPKVIVTLGATAVEGLLGLTGGITRLRGNFQDFRGIPAMPTFHPSYLLRDEAQFAKRQVWEDMLKVMEKLGLSITEKQRNYFLKSG